MQVRSILDGSMSSIRENGVIKAVCARDGFSDEKVSKSKPSSAKKQNGELSPKKQKHLSPTDLSKRFESPSKKGVKRTRDELSETDSDMPLAELQNCVSDDDDDIVLSKLNKASKKLKKSHSQTKGLENQGMKMKSAMKQNGRVAAAGAADEDDDDVVLAVIKKKKIDTKQQSKSVKNSSPKKKVWTHAQFTPWTRHVLSPV